MSYPDEAWERLGRLLVQRRPQIDPAYRNRQRFISDTGLNERLVADLENARRTGYRDATIAAVEIAYRLPQGSITKALADPSLRAFESKTPQQRLGELLPSRRIELDPSYAARRAFSAAVGLDETFVEDVEYGRLAVLDAAQQAAIENAYCWARGSVSTVLAGGDPTPVDVRRVAGSSYLAASGAVVAVESGEMVVLDLRSAPAGAPDHVRSLWNNFRTDQRIIWNLPIPWWERQMLIDHQTAVRQALVKARQEERGSNGDTRAG